MVIALIDYGAGNLRSVHKALTHLGASVHIAERPEHLKDASAVVFPGVGAFGDCVQALRRQELASALQEFARSGRPFLGICIGYQALFERSEESDSSATGLAWFAGRVVRFTGSDGLKVPQIGWNRLEIVRPDCPLFSGIPSGSYFYFVHSYYPVPADPDLTAARTTYGETFASAIWKDNVFATQFHPEKSQAIGLRLLQNFVTLAEGRTTALA